MGVTYQDVAMLNNSMANMGNAFRQSRLDSEAIKSRQIEDDLRRQTLDLARGRDAREAQGEAAACLTGDDGGIVEFKGTPDALNKVLEQARARGQHLRVTEAPKKKASIGTFTTQTPLGEFTFHLDDEAAVDKVTALAKQIGGARKQQGEFKTAPMANSEHLAKLQEAVDLATDPAEKSKAEQALASFKALLPGNKQDPEEFATETTEYPEVPAQPGTPAIPEKKHWFRANEPAVPEVPATAGQPARKVTRKVRLDGTEPGAPRIDAPVAAAGPKHPTRALAADYVKKYGGKAIAQLKADGYDPTAYAD